MFYAEIGSKKTANIRKMRPFWKLVAIFANFQNGLFFWILAVFLKVKSVLLDAEFVLVLYQNYQKQTSISWEIAFFRRVLKMGDFGQNAKGGPLLFWPKWPIFMAQIRKPRKIGNTYQILVKMVLLDVEFILLFIGTKTSNNIKKKTLISWEIAFSDECSKWAILLLLTVTRSYLMA